MRRTTARWLVMALAGSWMVLGSPSALAGPGREIGDFVWEDINRNGLQDDGEPGIAGVSVSLAGDCAGGTTTDATGHYLVSFATFGTRCYLRFLPPTLSHARYEATISGVWMGSDVSYYDWMLQSHQPMASNDSDVGIFLHGYNVTPKFTLPLRDTEDGDEWPVKVDAGFIRWVNGGVGGRVWNDSNRNGQQDAGERSLAGVTVELMVSLNQVGASITTDATGSFSFDDLRSDWNYLLRVQPLTGWAFTATDVGSDLTDNDFAAMGAAGVANALLFRLGSAEQRTSFGAGLFDPNAPPVPEPAAWALWLAGGAGLGLTAVKRRRRHAADARDGGDLTA